MSDETKSKKKRLSVFVSCAKSEWDYATSFVQRLRSLDCDAWLNTHDLEPGRAWMQTLRERLEPRNSCFLLFSREPSYGRWDNPELFAALNEIYQRDITFFPVLLEPGQEPPKLEKFRWFDFNPRDESGFEALVDSLFAINDIDFKRLSSEAFEALIVELLTRLGFDITDRAETPEGNVPDLVAEFKQQDPLGFEARVLYAFELKIFNDKRTDLRAALDLLACRKKNPDIDRLCLVTSSVLTSVTTDWLGSSREARETHFRVLDAPELKRLLVEHRDLIRKYFGSEPESSNP
jgi:hypothetical protein